MPTIDATTPTTTLPRATAFKAWLRAGVPAAVLAGGMVVVGDDVVEANGLTALDRPVLDWVLAHRTPAETAVATVVTTLGGTLAMTVLAVLVAAWALWRQRRAAAALVLVVAAGAGGLVALVKAVVGRARPPQVVQLVLETNPSFPSGHTLGSTAVIGATAIVLLAGVRSSWLRAAGVVAAIVAIVAVGVSRLYLGVHWATDVLAGWLMGSAWLLLCVATLSALTASSTPAPRTVQRIR